MEERRVGFDQIKAFRNWLIAEEKSKATIEKYIHDLRHFENYVNGRLLDKGVTREYKAVLEKKYAITSANSMIAALNAFMKFMGWNELCVKPFKIQKLIYCSEEKELTKEEYFRLMKLLKMKGMRELL